MPLIILTGIDFCGKSTIAKLLYHALDAEKLQAVLTKQPGGSLPGLRQYILENDLDARTEMFLFMADRCHHTKNVIIPALDKEGIVICERFSESTFIYQCIAKGETTYLFKECDEFARNGVEPNLTIYLKIPVEVAIERSKNGNRKLDRFENQKMLDIVYQGFEFMAQQQNKWVTVDATRSPDLVTADVVAEIKKLL